MQAKVHIAEDLEKSIAKAAQQRGNSGAELVVTTW
jgi:hypothetical protein